MTRTELRGVVERWRLILIPEWRVVLMDAPYPDSSGDGYWAEAECKDDYQEICIHFTDACLARGGVDVETTVVHELLHAVTRPWRQQIDSVASDLPSAVYGRLRAARVHEEEQVVDRLARVLVAGSKGFGTREYV
jgi:hypothetical protein